MNPTYGIFLWILIGALAGWLANKLMGADTRQGPLTDVLIGIGGALVGGYIAHLCFGDDPGNNGFFTSLGVALLGSCIVIWVGQRLFKR
jgi:uncharacterized membrane protein YeaQ/YmgE (transglycosylase-associated protein family)